MATHHYVAALQTSKDALLVQSQRQDGATGLDAVADGTVIVQGGLAGQIGAGVAGTVAAGRRDVQFAVGRAIRID